jgi:hypothetical protein
VQLLAMDCRNDDATRLVSWDAQTATATTEVALVHEVAWPAPGGALVAI